jgi:hypothetical protein
LEVRARDILRGRGSSKAVVAREPIWELRNTDNQRLVCFITPRPRGYVLHVERDGRAVLAEFYLDERAALSRAGTLHWERTRAGWTTPDPPIVATYLRAAPLP